MKAILEFEKEVKYIHKGKKYEKKYLAAINFVKLQSKLFN